MPRQGQPHLVNPANILTRPQLEAEDLIFRDLILLIPTPDTAIQFAAERGLLANSSTCQRCNRPRFIRHDAARGDGVIWRCSTCHSAQSIRAGSFFSKSNLSIDKILLFSYGWSRDWSAADCSREAGGLATEAQTDWGMYFRDVCQEEFNRHPAMIGGYHVDANGVMSPAVVEIDETLVAKPKYNRGRAPGQRWVFGGVCRGSKDCFLVTVPDRTRQTLEAAIQAHVLPGTHLLSDGWASYGQIDRIGGGIFTHEVIIHEMFFVDPTDDQVHTQSVENQ
jgi:hypothetical protein